MPMMEKYSNLQGRRDFSAYLLYQYNTMQTGTEIYKKTAFDLFGEKAVYQYEYIHTNESRFAAEGETLEECRKKRDKWLTAFSVAFTGHRTNRILQAGPDALAKIVSDLRNRLHALCSAGYHTYYCGMAEGFDLIAAEQVMLLKTQFVGIRLIAVVPFREQEARFCSAARGQYAKVLQSADEVVILADRYFEGCFMKRNDYLLRHAGRVVAYFDGVRHGGTAYTVRQAEKKGLPVDNLFDR